MGVGFVCSAVLENTTLGWTLSRLDIRAYSEPFGPYVCSEHIATLPCVFICVLLAYLDYRRQKCVDALPPAPLQIRSTWSAYITVAFIIASVSCKRIPPRVLEYTRPQFFRIVHFYTAFFAYFVEITPHLRTIQI